VKLENILSFPTLDGRTDKRLNAHELKCFIKDCK
jgi:hypothetical protein